VPLKGLAVAIYFCVVNGKTSENTPIVGLGQMIALSSTMVLQKASTGAF